MNDALARAEADLEEAQAALDENPDSRPAQVDYEGKHQQYTVLAAIFGEPDPADPTGS